MFLGDSKTQFHDSFVNNRNSNVKNSCQTDVYISISLFDDFQARDFVFLTVVGDKFSGILQKLAGTGTLLTANKVPRVETHSKKRARENRSTISPHYKQSRRRRADAIAIVLAFARLRDASRSEQTR